MRDSSMATHLRTSSCGGFDGVNGTASPPVHLSYPSSSIVSCNTHGSWKDEHCRRYTPPLPGCLFQPRFKIHDSSFKSVMIGRCRQSCGVRSDRSPSSRGLPQGRTLGLFTSKSPTQGHTLANLAGAERDHEIVRGGKVLEATVVSAVLLRWLMK